PTARSPGTSPLSLHAALPICIHQHPVAVRHAFDARLVEAVLAQSLEQLVGNGADMTVGAAGGHDHVVGQRRLAGDVDGDGVLGLDRKSTRLNSSHVKISYAVF